MKNFRAGLGWSESFVDLGGLLYPLKPLRRFGLGCMRKSSVGLGWSYSYRFWSVITSGLRIAHTFPLSTSLCGQLVLICYQTLTESNCGCFPRESLFGNTRQYPVQPHWSVLLGFNWHHPPSVILSFQCLWIDRTVNSSLYTLASRRQPTTTALHPFCKTTTACTQAIIFFKSYLYKDRHSSLLHQYPSFSVWSCTLKPLTTL